MNVLMDASVSGIRCLYLIASGRRHAPISASQDVSLKNDELFSNTINIPCNPARVQRSLQAVVVKRVIRPKLSYGMALIAPLEHTA